MKKDNLPNKKKEIYVSRRKFNDNGDVIEKICSSCKEWKSDKDYYKDKSVLDGLYNNCKLCFGKRQKQTYDGGGKTKKDFIDESFENLIKLDENYVDDIVREIKMEEIDKRIDKYNKENNTDIGKDN
tara:strand:- start:483 stop:863 length:381 start_codon:yes stop_codon:yes gene_type:complete